MNSLPEILTLSNGVRVVHRRSTGHVSYIGACINAGSREDPADRHGLAHFVEHTIFKGTPTRRSWQISSRMESIGGELNAYTSKEETMIYTNAPVGYAPRAFELIGDLIANSIFPEPDVEREREVVIEEIKSYLDSPSDSVYDDFEELIYRDSALAHNILGTAETVRTLRGSDCRKFITSLYSPSRIVVYCVDPSPVATIARLAEKHFGNLSQSGTQLNRIAPVSLPVFEETRDKGNMQANTIVGARIFGRQDPRRHAMFLLNNYLGGPCMNSVLNRELRERRGLVYTVDSSVALLSDCGTITIYYGCDPSENAKCASIIRHQLENLASNVLAPRTFETVKKQYCGQLLVGSDHRESMAMSLAKSVMYYDRVHDVAHTAEKIKAVTAEDMRQAAELILNNGLNRLTIL